MGWGAAENHKHTPLQIHWCLRDCTCDCILCVTTSRVPLAKGRSCAFYSAGEEQAVCSRHRKAKPQKTVVTLQPLPAKRPARGRSVRFNCSTTLVQAHSRIQYVGQHGVSSERTQAFEVRFSLCKPTQGLAAMRLSKPVDSARTMGLGRQMFKVLGHARLPAIARQAQNATGAGGGATRSQAMHEVQTYAIGVTEHMRLLFTNAGRVNGFGLAQAVPGAALLRRRAAAAGVFFGGGGRSCRPAARNMDALHCPHPQCTSPDAVTPYAALAHADMSSVAAAAAVTSQQQTNQAGVAPPKLVRRRC